MSRATNAALGDALPQRARLALEVARSYDIDCDATTAFCVAAAHPGWGIERLQKAIRSQTRRERGQRVFTPTGSKPAGDKPLTADLGRETSSAEPFHLDDPAALAELFEFMEVLAADPEACKYLALADEHDALARRRTELAAKALALTRRRVEQMKRQALAAEAPREFWADAIRARARRETTKARRKKAMRARARLHRGEAPTQLTLFKRGGRGHG